MLRPFLWAPKMISQMCRGSVIISPTLAFSIFNNSTLYNSLAVSHAGKEQLPSLIEEMAYSEFSLRFKGAIPSGLYFPKEHYYFQGIPPAAPLQALLHSKPLACANTSEYCSGPRIPIVPIVLDLR